MEYDGRYFIIDETGNNVIGYVDDGNGVITYVSYNPTVESFSIKIYNKRNVINRLIALNNESKMFGIPHNFYIKELI